MRRLEFEISTYVSFSTLFVDLMSFSCLYPTAVDRSFELSDRPFEYFEITMSRTWFELRKNGL